jgi:hypothetical protein
VQVLQELSEGVPEEGGEGVEAAGRGGGAPVSHSMGRGAVAYLAMRALLALGRAAEAQTELLAVASAPDSPLPLCISGMKVWYRDASTWHDLMWEQLRKGNDDTHRKATACPVRRLIERCPQGWYAGTASMWGGGAAGSGAGIGGGAA